MEFQDSIKSKVGLVSNVIFFFKLTSTSEFWSLQFWSKTEIEKLCYIYLVRGKKEHLNPKELLTYWESSEHICYNFIFFSLILNKFWTSWANLWLKTNLPLTDTFKSPCSASAAQETNVSLWYQWHLFNFRPRQRCV